MKRSGKGVSYSASRVWNLYVDTKAYRSLMVLLQINEAVAFAIAAMLPVDCAFQEVHI